MTSLSTHVLDLASGRPAADVAVTLLRRQGPDATAVASRLTDADGRARLLEAGQLVPGGWRLTYDIGAYYARGRRPGSRVRVPRRGHRRLRRRR